MRTPLVKAFKELKGQIKEEHMVFSFYIVFNVNNIIKMRIIAVKDIMKQRT